MSGHFSHFSRNILICQVISRGFQWIPNTFSRLKTCASKWGRSSHYQYSLHHLPRWCRISAINSISNNHWFLDLGIKFSNAAGSMRSQNHSAQLPQFSVGICTQIEADRYPSSPKASILGNFELIYGNQLQSILPLSLRNDGAKPKLRHEWC